MNPLIMFGLITIATAIGIAVGPSVGLLFFGLPCLFAGLWDTYKDIRCSRALIRTQYDT